MTKLANVHNVQLILKSLLLIQLSQILYSFATILLLTKLLTAFVTEATSKETVFASFKPKTIVTLLLNSGMADTVKTTARWAAPPVLTTNKTVGATYAIEAANTVETTLVSAQSANMTLM